MKLATLRSSVKGEKVGARQMVGLIPREMQAVSYWPGPVGIAPR
jgi:hypothetical protein